MTIDERQLSTKLAYYQKKSIPHFILHVAAGPSQTRRRCLRASIKISHRSARPTNRSKSPPDVIYSGRTGQGDCHLVKGQLDIDDEQRGQPLFWRQVAHVTQHRRQRQLHVLGDVVQFDVEGVYIRCHQSVAARE